MHSDWQDCCWDSCLLESGCDPFWQKESSSLLELDGNPGSVPSEQIGTWLELQRSKVEH